ncbi:hypothetical protein BDW02DRAFT_579777 [Decorospora gaudefroyi]|uniref:Uncharacterized protein n=1 Tax=Decorospora gaudefroyi TaxID=184978 RepID=A0A6A5KA79_9PLEO|nr:hypothetical protein BDW02DRAFT_579777 [Decorospora gaudefroyi]
MVGGGQVCLFVGHEGERKRLGEGAAQASPAILVAGELRREDLVRRRGGGNGGGWETPAPIVKAAWQARCCAAGNAQWDAAHTEVVPVASVARRRGTKQLKPEMGGEDKMEIWEALFDDGESLFDADRKLQRGVQTAKAEAEAEATWAMPCSWTFCCVGEGASRCGARRDEMEVTYVGTQRVEEARPAVVCNYYIVLSVPPTQAGEDACVDDNHGATTTAGKGLLGHHEGTRHDGALYTLPAQRGSSPYLTRLTLAVALPLSLSLLASDALLPGRPPWSCGHHPGMVASNGHLGAGLSQLPGFAALAEGAQCDSLTSKQRRALRTSSVIHTDS